MDNNRPLNEEFYKKINDTNGFLKHTEICNLFQIVAGIHADY